jgi:hypothetical protein
VAEDPCKRLAGVTKLEQLSIEGGYFVSAGFLEEEVARL